MRAGWPSGLQLLAPIAIGLSLKTSEHAGAPAYAPVEASV